MHLPSPLRGAAIDLDGTLLDTVLDLALCANLTLRDLGHRELAAEQLRGFIGNGVPTFLCRALTASTGQAPADSVLNDAVCRFDGHYAANFTRHSAVYPGVVEGLTRLRAHGLRLACVTNKPAGFTVALLEHAGLLAFFEAIVGGDTLPVKKPDPAPLLHACSQLGVPPAQVLMIGDSPVDIATAGAAGCPVVVMSYGYNQGQDLAALPINGLADSLVTVAEALGA